MIIKVYIEMDTGPTPTGEIFRYYFVTSFNVFVRLCFVLFFLVDEFNLNKSPVQQNCQ